MRTCFRSAGLLLALVFTITAGRAQEQSAPDLDRDGVPDSLEQALLNKFHPNFLVSAGDCDVRPAEFVSGRRKAIVFERNGTIYGQVFLLALPAAVRQAVAADGETVLEIHYYHLWARDCGRMGHSLDPEHVAVLVHAPALASPLSEWQAVWWYAAAHERTVCDRSSIARASSLSASDRGPTVWISSGKHAAFLSPDDCSGGCGQDHCSDAIPLSPAKLINLGEPSAPLNGALWTRSRQWSLAEKMETSFGPASLALADETLAGLATSSRPVPAVRPHPKTQAVISAGGSSLDGVATGGHETSSALAIGSNETGRAIGTANGKVQAPLRKAGRAVRNWFSKTTQPQSEAHGAAN